MQPLYSTTLFNSSNLDTTFHIHLIQQYCRDTRMRYTGKGIWRNTDIVFEWNLQDIVHKEKLKLKRWRVYYCIYFFNKININFIVSIFRICCSPWNQRWCCTWKRITHVRTVACHNTQHLVDKIWWSNHLSQNIRFCSERESIVNHLIQKLQIATYILVSLFQEKLMKYDKVENSKWYVTKESQPWRIRV